MDQGKYASYLYFHGLLDKYQYGQLDEIDGTILEMIKNKQWLEAWQTSDQQLNFILQALNYSNLYDISKDQYRPSTMNFWSWLNTESVRQAIHVGSVDFSDGLNVYMAMVEDTMRSVKPYLEEVLKHYRVLNYNGARDIICHYPGTEDMYSRTNWPGHAQFIKSHRNNRSDITGTLVRCWRSFSFAPDIHSLKWCFFVSNQGACLVGDYQSPSEEIKH